MSLATLKKTVQGHVGIYSTMEWDGECQQALQPRLSAIIYRLVQGTA
jgi:hypothetical protein